MSPGRTPFPFPPLPEGEVSPRHEPGHWYDLVQRDARMVRWLVEEHMLLKVGASPLGKLLDAYAKVDPNATVPVFDDIPPERRRYGLHISAQFERLAWAIWALYGSEGRVERMDGSFVTREVLDADTKEREAEQVLPGGIGTMMFAGRCHHRRLRVPLPPASPVPRSPPVGVGADGFRARRR